MTPVATFSGLASGLDTSRIVQELVQLERRPIQLLQRRQADLSAMAKRLSDLSTKLKAVAEAAAELDDRADVLRSSATSSDEASVAVTAEGAASLGSFAVSVTSLARAERTYGDAFAASDETGLFGTGTLTIQVGSDTAVDIDIGASDTLESVAQKINAADVDVTAGLLFDGTSYRLQVSGNTTGADRAITFTEGGTLALGLDDPANEVQSAADAAFSIDGFAMTRSSNLVTDAIPGVTLELKGPTSSNVTVTVSRDPAALEERVRSFVEAYNAVADAIAAEFAFTGEARLGDSLSGDSTLRGLQSRLRKEAGAVLSGLSGSFGRLSEIGVELDASGRLELDEATLSEALAEDPESVSALLAGDGTTEGFMARFGALVEEYTRSSDGLLSARISSLDGRRRGIDDQIDRMELGIERYERRLREQFTAMEQMISTLQSQSSQLLAMMGQLGG